jgi:hypothetical protein
MQNSAVGQPCLVKLSPKMHIKSMGCFAQPCLLHFLAAQHAAESMLLTININTML